MEISQQIKNGERALTFFNTVFVGVLLVHGLALVGAGDTLHALVEVVLGRCALSRFFALCRYPLAFRPITSRQAPVLDASRPGLAQFRRRPIGRQL
jgi:hypothetical protein